MKKTLVFAMAMALGVSATAFAANPFSDVPAGHWAYASIAKLAAAGIVDGYPDGSFRGDKTMTRYEMAQLVAKALAKGAIGCDDKLVGEFADELDNLGVRVAKLEKKADNVKITGNIRIHYADIKKGSNANGLGNAVDTYSSKFRTRMFLNGEINDNWTYTGMLQNEQDFTNDNGDSTTRFQRAFVTGRYGDFTFTAGRHNDTVAEGNIYDSRVDGVKLVYGNKTKLTAAYGKMSSIDGAFDSQPKTAYKENGSAAGKYWRVALGTKLGKDFDAEANYISAKDVDKIFNKTSNPYDQKVISVGANYKTDKWGLGAMWLHGTTDYTDTSILNGDGSNNGYVISLNLGYAKASKPGSVGLWAKYYSEPASTVIAHTFVADYDPAFGFKGYAVGIDYTLAKNMVAGVQYYGLKNKDGNTDDSNHKTLWSQLIVTF